MSFNERDLLACCLRARELVSRGRAQDALSLYDDVIRADPEYAMAYADRGTTDGMAKRPDKAIEDLQRAIFLGYRNAPSYCSVGNAYLEMGEVELSLNFFDRAVELDPTYPFTYYNRARALYKLGDSAAAVADLGKCLEFGPGEVFTRVLLDQIAQYSATWGNSL